MAEPPPICVVSRWGYAFAVSCTETGDPAIVLACHDLPLDDLPPGLPLGLEFGLDQAEAVGRHLLAEVERLRGKPGLRFVAGGQGTPPPPSGSGGSPQSPV